MPSHGWGDGDACWRVAASCSVVGYTATALQARAAETHARHFADITGGSPLPGYYAGSQFSGVGVGTGQFRGLFHTRRPEPACPSPSKRYCVGSAPFHPSLTVSHLLPGSSRDVAGVVGREQDAWQDQGAAPSSLRTPLDAPQGQPRGRARSSAGCGLRAEIVLSVNGELRRARFFQRIRVLQMLDAIAAKERNLMAAGWVGDT